MSQQATGALARLSFVPEVTWNTTPGTPSMKLLKAATPGEGLGADFAEVISKAINAKRAIEWVRLGNADIKGAVPFEVAPLGIGTILKHALGTVSTSGSGPYTHVIKRGSLPVGMSIEKAFLDLATPYYVVFTGCKPNSMSLSIPADGLITGSLDMIAGGFSGSTTSLGSPTAVAHTPFMDSEAAFEVGGSGATVLNANIQIGNNLEAVKAAGSRYIAALNDGKGDCTGEFTLMFTDTTEYAKWAAETASSFKATFTSGANSIEWYFPSIVYTGDAVPKIANDQGIVVPFKFRAKYDSGTATDVRVTIVSTESTI